MAYTPISTMFNTPFSTTTVLSPLTPVSIRSVSPLSPLTINSYNIPSISQSFVTNSNPMTVVTPIGPMITTMKPSYVIDIDTGMDDNFYVQRDITKYLLYKTLDKWIFSEFPGVLKFLIVKDDTVTVVKNEEEKDKNEISKNSADENRKKIDWIEENILGENEMKDILKLIMYKTGVKIYDMPHKESMVMEVVEKYLKKKLRGRMEDNKLKEN